MLSPSITSMLDRVRSEFGILADVLDVNLASALAPGRQRETGVRLEPEIAAAVAEAARDGRSTEIETAGRRVRIVPLRRNRAVAALLVLETHGSGPPELSGRVLEGLVELLRSAIEAELGCRDDIHTERQQNRMLRGVLRFLRYVLLADTEAEVAEAVIQASAVWFDVDPRVYRRGPAGDYELFSYLPAAEVTPGSERLARLDFAPDSTVMRLSSLHELRNLGPARDGLLVPAWGGHGVEWILVVFGTVPAEAEFTLSIVGRLFGAQMERLALRRAADLRSGFEEAMMVAEPASEVAVLEALRQLLRMTRGGAAALWVQTADGMRRLGLVGGPIADPGPELRPAHVVSPARHVRTLRVGEAALARLELASDPETPFGDDATAVVDACASMLRIWLTGAGISVCDRAFSEDPLSGFLQRIEEEMARARRFDRRLALLLVQTPADAGTHSHVHDLLDLLRRELRGSDLLGSLGRDQIAVLLVETDAKGLGSVVRRVRARLGEAITSKSLPALAIGEAAFSEECTTVSALLSRAQYNAQRVPDTV